MSTKLEKRYGLPTAIAMVIGIVVGSGVFFKAEKILTVTSGNLPTAILSWLIGGLIMIVCAYTFAVMGTKYEKVNGIVDYAEAIVGSKYAYIVGWFMAVVYSPTIGCALMWLSGRYFGALFGFSATSPQVMVFSLLFLVGTYAVNALSPKLAGKVQVSATVIKLIPLILMGVVGTIAGLINGVTVENIAHMVDKTTASGVYYAVPRTSFIDLKLLFPAVCATSFAYEGWIMATTINSELRNGKKNLPKALIVGTLGTVIIYILYYIGLAGAVTTPDLMNNSASYAFTKLFGSVAGTVLTVFIVVSCLGTLNGIMMSCTRGMYSLAIRNEGLAPEVMKQVDNKTNMPTNSSVFGLLMTVIWFFYFYAAQLQTDNKPWFGVIDFDPTELPIIATYLLYIPIFIMIIVKEKDLGIFKRFVAPVLSIAGSVVMIIACIESHKTDNLWFLLVLGIIILIGLLLPNGKKAKKTSKAD